MCTLQSSPRCVESNWTPTIKQGICSQVQYAILVFYLVLLVEKKAVKPKCYTVGIQSGSDGIILPQMSFLLTSRCVVNIIKNIGHIHSSH